MKRDASLTRPKGGKVSLILCSSIIGRGRYASFPLTAIVWGLGGKDGRLVLEPCLPCPAVLAWLEACSVRVPAEDAVGRQDKFFKSEKVWRPATMLPLSAARKGCHGCQDCLLSNPGQP
jgi:hypothetical protein